MKNININKGFGSTLFLVGSPFQCLCMLEAINYFKIDYYDILITNTDDGNIEKIDKLLKKHDIKYTKIKVEHLFFSIIPLLFSKHKYYKNIFIGYLYSKTSFAIANIYASFNANIYIIDDGVQALSFFSSKPRIIKTSHRVKKIVESFYNLIGYVKLVKKPTFFTIFDVQSSEYQIINNPFKLLESKLGKIKEKNGIYIIGTNSSMLDFKDYTYRDYIISLHKYIMCKYLVDEIYYCPHRRDRNLEDIIVLCKHLGIKIYDTKVSVEYDFIENNINPKLIIGFTSNALFTLHLLYPSSDIKTVMYNLKSEQADTETQIIRNRLNESGISTIEIF